MAFNGTNNGGVIIEVGNWKGQSYSGVKVEKTSGTMSSNDRVPAATMTVIQLKIIALCNVSGGSKKLVIVLGWWESQSVF